MSIHDAEYFRRSSRAPGNPTRDPFCAPKFLQRATELQSLGQLPWPRNLFGELASIAELMAESSHASEHTDDACSCGCRAEYRQNVSQTLGSPYGGGFDAIYFRSEQVEPGAEAERGAVSLRPDGPTCERRLGHQQLRRVRRQRRLYGHTIHTTSMSWLVTAWSCSVRSPPWLKAPGEK